MRLLSPPFANVRSAAKRALFDAARSTLQGRRFGSASNSFANQVTASARKKRSPMYLKTGITAGGLISAAYLLDQQQHEKSSQCDIAAMASTTNNHLGIFTNTSNFKIQKRKSRGGKGDSASFQILQALEVKEEFHKIKLARFLQEIHALASEQEHRPKLLRQATSLKRRKTKQGEISLRGVDLKNLSREAEAKYQEQLRVGRKLSRDSILELTKAATDVIHQDDTVVDLRKVSPEKVMIVGDLHGSLRCLDNVLEINGGFDDPDKYLVFCGDYVDRGENSLEVFCSILFLKLAHPKNVILLRGNHEDVLISSVYGFQDEIRKKYGAVDSEWVWKEMSQVFSSLPICARTEHALIVHAGIPCRDFNLSDIQDISAESRSRIETVVEARNEQEKLLEGMLWSDPSMDDGIAYNPRGCGILFGPDVARDFMDRHGLKYIFRSHEPSETGAHGMPCGDGKWVITVFSTAMYPNGEGSNYGAVVELDDVTGIMKPIQFTYSEEELLGKTDDSEKWKAYGEILTEYIAENRLMLENEFRKIDRSGLVCKEDWAKVMSKQLEMPDAAWISLQKALAPTTTPNGNMINWRHFLNKHNPNLNLNNLEEEQVALLHAHHEKLLNLFKVLDVDGNGSIDRDEFISGIAMLNKTCLADGKQFANPEELFNTFDLDGNGEIDLDEFKSVLEKSKKLSSLAKSVDGGKIQALQQNHEMLLAAFHFLDQDGSGTIDREEFRRGINLLNKRLPVDGQFGNPDELFSAIDGDGSGEIDIEEFSQILRRISS